MWPAAIARKLPDGKPTAEQADIAGICRVCVSAPKLACSGCRVTTKPVVSVLKYTVQPGDTLRSIAAQFNVSVTAIVEANKLTPQQADSLRVGQELIIPAP